MMTPTKPDCPTCSAAHERHRERDAAAYAEWRRTVAAANAERLRALATAYAKQRRTRAAVAAELDHVLVAHPNHQEATDAR